MPLALNRIKYMIKNTFPPARQCVVRLTFSGKIGTDPKWKVYYTIESVVVNENANVACITMIHVSIYCFAILYRLCVVWQISVIGSKKKSSQRERDLLHIREIYAIA